MAPRGPSEHPAVIARYPPRARRSVRKAEPTRRRLFRQPSYGSLTPFLCLCQEDTGKSWARPALAGKAARRKLRTGNGEQPQSRWRASQEARRERSWPSGPGHSSYGSSGASRGAFAIAGLDQVPRVPGRVIDGLVPVVRQLVANVRYCTQAAEIDALLRQRQCDRGVRTRDLDASRVLRPLLARAADRDPECVVLLRVGRDSCQARTAAIRHRLRWFLDRDRRGAV